LPDILIDFEVVLFYLLPPNQHYIIRCRSQLCDPIQALLLQNPSFSGRRDNFIYFITY